MATTKNGSKRNTVIEQTKMMEVISDLEKLYASPPPCESELRKMVLF